MHRQAAATDKIRVVVGARAACALEGNQDKFTRQHQRQDIGSVQSTIERALSQRDAVRIKRLTAVPIMAMEVDADQLEALAAMPVVTDIQDDRQAWASLAQSVPLIQADDAWSAGRLGNRLGDFVEIMVKPAPVRLFSTWGIALHEVHRIVSADCQGEVVEIDLLVVNDSDVIMA